MRDAFGGAFAIKLFLVFIFIYIFFTAIALNYARAFKVKNKVIDYLEDNEIITISKMSAKEFEEMSYYFENELMGKDSFNHYTMQKNDMNCTGLKPEVYCDNGIRILQMDANRTKSDSLGVYYRVETYFPWSIPFLQKLTALSNDSSDGDVAKGIWVISGETRTIIQK